MHTSESLSCAGSNLNLNLTIVSPLISHRLPEKPWQVPGADIGDLFNCGMNEETGKVAAWVIRMGD